MKFRKRPVVIEAFRYLTHEIPSWAEHIKVTECRRSMIIETLDGQMIAGMGDWIIRGIKGEVYPCKDDIFRETYEEVEE